MKNLMVAFTLFVLGRIYPFWANFVEKIRIVSLSWNLVPLVPILIRICIIQCFTILFLVIFGPKIQIVSLRWNSVQSLIQICRIWWKYLFSANLVQKVKIVSLSWNLVLILIRTWRIERLCLFFLLSNGSILFLENLF